MIENIISEDAEIAAGFFYGLPEAPIRRLVLKNCDFSFKKEATSGYLAMMDDIPTYCRAGLVFNHVDCVTLEHVTFTDVLGETVVLNHVRKVVK